MGVERNAKGKRPLFYEAPGMDQAMSMILVLANEVMVVRDRLDTVERLAAAKGLILEADIESYEPDQPVLEAREARRQEFLARLYYLARKQAAEAANGDTAERYTSELDAIAAGEA
jgi:hypothetical protein